MNTVNKLMDILPEDPVDWTNEHIEQVIKWQKKMFFEREQNFGKKKSNSSQEEQSLLLEKALLEMAQTPIPTPKTTFRRRL
jgi:hypothetical protein